VTAAVRCCHHCCYHCCCCPQVLFGSSPIASCRQPYAVVRYLAEASWPRLQDTLKLHTYLDSVMQQQQQSPGAPPLQDAASDGELSGKHQQQQQQPQQLEQTAVPGVTGSSDGSRVDEAAATAAAVAEGGTDSRGWSPWTLCEALAVKRHWVLPRSGRLDTYRAANWLLRAALAGQQHVGLAFLPPVLEAAAVPSL
jgi:hypothetical protein